MYQPSVSTPLLRVGSYNYRAATNLSRTTTFAINTPVVRARTWSENPNSKKEEENSMRDAIFTLVATSMETGCLSLPIVLKYVGLIPGVFIILLSAGASYVSMNGISLAAERRNLFDYSRLVKDLLGKNTSIFLDIILVLYLFFSVSGYQLICNESILSAFLYFDIRLSDYIFFIMLAYSLMVVFPMSLLQKVTELKVFSFISIGSILYICISIVVDFPNYVKNNGLASLKLYNFDLYFFSAVTFAIFSFTCHMSVATVFSEMRDPSKSRMKAVNFRVCFYQLLIYLLLAIIGYLSLLEETPMFITQRNSPSSITNSLQIMIARILVCFVLMVTMTLFMILCRQSIQSLINAHKPQVFSNFW
jgi:amino acid permease